MGYRLAIVGATGNVGREMLQILSEREFPADDVVALASSASLGREISYGDHTRKVRDLAGFDFKGTDLVLSSAGAKVSAAHAPRAAKAGAVVIDNTSQFRMDPDVPLVVPEVNRHAISGWTKKGIIANPNCSTAVMLMGLWPLHQKFGLKRVIVSTYQSVSGTGAEAVRELADQIQAHVAGQPIVHKVYPYQIAFNCIPHIDSFGSDGYTGEESKMAQESRKIMGLPNLKVSATTVRVPVVRAHPISVCAEFERPVNLAEARAAVAAFPGAELVDDTANKRYPTPLDFAEKVKCGVGRLRIDTAFDNGLSFWVSGDNLWKGAALNALQNAELMIHKGWLKPKA
jgi:aspartate-semialdehyde dehydrogenase